MNFKERVLLVVKEIKSGHTLSYQQVAQLAGSPGAQRAVGSVLKQNYDPSIPCHRVIRSNGSVGEYNKGAQLKKELLSKEKLF